MNQTTIMYSPTVVGRCLLTLALTLIVFFGCNSDQSALSPLNETSSSNTTTSGSDSGGSNGTGGTSNGTTAISNGTTTTSNGTTATSGDVGMDSMVTDDASMDTQTEEDTTETVPDIDAVSDTTEPEDTAPDLPEPMLTIEIVEPRPGTAIPTGTPIVWTGRIVESTAPLEELSVVWRSSVDGMLAEGVLADDGTVTATIDTLSLGDHLVTLEVEGPEGLSAETSVFVSVCAWREPERFDSDVLGSGWQTFGDAFWDPRGWLEMTDNVQDRKGAIFRTDSIIDSGDLSLRFRIATGGGSGADGFAMSIIDADDPEDLARLINAAGTGGALGYGYGGDWGRINDVSAFHVEFDTWHNRFNGTNEHHTDPTPENHVGVMLNGDPGEHYLWAAIPTIEDLEWHAIAIDITGSQVVVAIDDVTVIDGTIDELDFKGGYIGFSGTTGFFTNFHRIDELLIEECLVP